MAEEKPKKSERELRFERLKEVRAKREKAKKEAEKEG